MDAPSPGTAPLSPLPSASASEPDVRRSLRAEQLRMFDANTPSMLVGNLLGAGFLLAVLWPQASASGIAAWTVLMLVALGLRTGWSLARRRQHPWLQDDDQALLRVRAAVAFAGLAWGCAALLLYPAAELSLVVFVVFVLAAMAAGSVILTAFDPLAHGLFGTLALMPLVLRLSASGQFETQAMAALVLLFMALLVTLGQRVWNNLRETIVLRCTEAARAAALARSQQQLSQLTDLLARKSLALEITLDSMDQGILSLGEDGRAQVFNRRLCTLLDLPEALLANAPTMEEIGRWQMSHGHFGPELSLFDAPARQSMQRWLAGDRQAFPEHYRRRTPSGAVLEVKTRYLAGGALVRTFTDVSDDVAAHRLLMAATEEAERANRAKSDFLSAMSHELRTPLNAILGFGQVMMQASQTSQTSQAPQSPQSSPTTLPPALAQQHQVKAIVQAGEHLLTLIDDMLDLSQVESGRLRVQTAAIALAPLAAECCQLAEPIAAAAGVVLRPIRSDGPAHEWQAVADARRLKQVLLNLLTNAIKYNHTGGWVQVALQVQADRVRIEVQDNGPGIDAHRRERLFSPFDRLGAEAGGVPGAGIGLALSRRLVEAMAGQIGMDARAEGGCSFWVSLPRGTPAAPPALPGVAKPGVAKPGAETPADGAARPDAAPPSPAIAAPWVAQPQPQPQPQPQVRGGRDRTAASRVLYIEDNPVNALLMEAMLALEPQVALSVAALPEEGLTLAQHLQPALILLDIQLPGLDGYQVLERLKGDERTRHIPVAAISANAMRGDVERGLAAGFVAYLPKPLMLDELLGFVRRSLSLSPSDLA